LQLASQLQLLKYSTRARRRILHQRFLPCHYSRRVEVCTALFVPAARAPLFTSFRAACSPFFTSLRPLDASLRTALCAAPDGAPSRSAPRPALPQHLTPQGPREPRQGLTRPTEEKKARFDVT
jgi:hypothetical protein